MWRRLGTAGAVFVVVFAGAQLVRPGHANPAIDPAGTIDSQVGSASALPAIVQRSCGDCHSNATVWPWYTKIAPLSWIMARAVSEGRKAVNFSEWTGYSPEQRRALLVRSCEDASSGKMPGVAYVRLRPDARLSAQDVEAICGASREPRTGAAVKSEAPSRSAR